MKHSKAILGAVFIAAIAITLVLMGSRRARLSESGQDSFAPAASRPLLAPSKPSRAVAVMAASAAPARARAANPVAALPWAAVPTAKVIQVRADQVLATVNDQPIHLKDLLAVAPDQSEASITEEAFQSRLKRAVEVELILQAARADGVGLTGEQERRLTRIAHGHTTRLAQYRQHGITWSSATSPQLEFERRLTSALMLQQNLVAGADGVAPGPDSGVQARYEEARLDMLGRLRAKAVINIPTPTL